MQSESKSTLLIFAGCVAVAAALGAVLWFGDFRDPEKLVDRYAGWFVVVAIGGYLIITIAIHMRRMVGDPEYCPKRPETFMGTGLMLVGRAERRVENDMQTCKTTLWISVLYIPLVPLRSFLVQAPLDWGWFSPKPFQVIERVPLRKRHVAFAVASWMAAACVAWLILRGSS